MVDFVLTYLPDTGPNGTKRKQYFDRLVSRGLDITYWCNPEKKNGLKYALLRLKRDVLIERCNLLQISLPLVGKHYICSIIYKPMTT